MNQACFGVDADGLGIETALKVPGLSYVVSRGCLRVILIELVVKLLCQCFCQGSESTELASELILMDRL